MQPRKNNAASLIWLCRKGCRLQAAGCRYAESPRAADPAACSLWPAANAPKSLALRAQKPLIAFGLMLLAATMLPCAPAQAGWKDKVGKLNRTVLSAEEARKRSAAEEEERRNKVAIRRLKPAHPMDWNADPTAVPQFLYQVNKRTGLPVYINNDGLDPASDELFDYTVLYFTGHLGFTLNEAEVENLTLFVNRGGTLYLDDCYLRGSAFGDSVPSQVEKLIPGAEPIVLLENDSRVSDTFKMIYGTAWPGTSGIGENRYWLYYLLDNRVAVFVSPNDDGCAWEVSTPPTAANPIGEGIGHGGNNYFREQVYQWTTNWILFALTN